MKKEKITLHITYDINNRWMCETCKLSSYNGCSSFLKHALNVAPCPGVVTKIKGVQNMKPKIKKIIILLVTLISITLLSNILLGCATVARRTDVDTRGLTGKILQDRRTGKLIIPEYKGENLFYLHELTPNGEIIFFK